MLFDWIENNKKEISIKKNKNKCLCIISNLVAVFIWFWKDCILSPTNTFLFSAISPCFKFCKIWKDYEDNPGDSRFMFHCAMCWRSEKTAPWSVWCTLLENSNLELWRFNTNQGIWRMWPMFLETCKGFIYKRDRIFIRFSYFIG